MECISVNKQDKKEENLNEKQLISQKNERVYEASWSSIVFLFLLFIRAPVFCHKLYGKGRGVGIGNVWF